MPKQFLYNTDRKTNTANQRTFLVGKEPIVISAAGLEECVPIFVSVGACPSCGPRDHIWTPLMNCGEPVEVCPGSTYLTLSVPGQYMFGAPDPVELVLTGDVNVMANDLATNHIGLAVSETRCSGPEADIECPPSVPRGLVNSWP